MLQHYLENIEMKLLFFGITRDIIGKGEIEGYKMKSGNTVDDLLNQLRIEYPELNKLKSLAVGVNQQYAQNQHPLQQDDEVALIPPVSGG